MAVRLKVALDETHLAGQLCEDFAPHMEARLVRSGLAERETLDEARARVGMDRLAPPDVDPPANMNMLRSELIELAEASGVAIENDDNKAELVRKINEAAP